MQACKDREVTIQGTRQSRIEVLRTAIESEVSWVDLEVDISVKDRESLMKIAKGKTQVIASHHSEEAPPPAKEIISEIEDYTKPWGHGEDLLPDFWLRGGPEDIRSRMGIKGFQHKDILDGNRFWRGLGKNSCPSSESECRIFDNADRLALIPFWENKCIRFSYCVETFGLRLGVPRISVFTV